MRRRCLEGSPQDVTAAICYWTGSIYPCMKQNTENIYLYVYIARVSSNENKGMKTFN